MELTAWSRQPGESEKAFDAFRRYLELGPERSVEALRRNYEKDGIRKSNRLLQGWSAEWRWIERCKAHADHVAAIENASRDKVREEEAAKWQRRRIQAAARNWSNSKKLERKAVAMLDLPLVEDAVEERDDGGRPIKVARKPAKWTLATAGALMKIVAELRAAALNEALGDDDDDFDPSTATPEECRAYLRREGVLSDKGEIKALPKPGRRQ